MPPPFAIPVVLSLLAFLALRRRKGRGWRRQRPIQLVTSLGSSKLEDEADPKGAFVASLGGPSDPGLPPQVVVGLPPPSEPGTGGGQAAPRAGGAVNCRAAAAAVGSSSLPADRLALLRSLEEASATSPRAA